MLNLFKIVYGTIVAAEQKKNQNKSMGDFGQVALILLCFILLRESESLAK